MSTAAPSLTVPAATPSTCFHCGVPVPAGSRHKARIDGVEQAFCCRGCQAVAEAIERSGLTDFYRYRTTPSRRAEDLVPESLRDTRLYDLPEVRKTFARSEGEHLRSASLMLEGIVCAACVWLNERHVTALPGVVDFQVNYSTHRALLRWDERLVRLSQILEAIAAIGYVAHPFDADRQQALHQRERGVALRRLAVAGLGSMQVMMLAVALYAGDYSGMDTATRELLRWTSLLLTVPVLVYSGWPFLAAAWRNLRQRGLGMDVPVSLAIVGAFAASAWFTWQGGGEVYFDSVTMFIFFLLGGRFLEMNARHRAGQVAEELVRLLPATATRLADDDTERTVAVAELRSGDRVLIRPGETVPADGRVARGESQVDESLLTGESVPQPKQVGARLIGGSLNTVSPLVMDVELIGGDTVLAAIVRLLERAQSEKPRWAELADRVAAWFVGLILLSALAVAIGWWQHDPTVAFRVALSVLVVTCPCALSLATPAAITAATGQLTRLGLLVTRGHALETLAGVTHVVFDKTGTLTHGRPHLVAVEPARALDAERCLAIAAALEQGSEHPLGQALSAAAPVSLRAEDVRNTPGQGIEGWVEGIRYRVGKPDYVAGLSDPPVTIPYDASALWIALGDEHGLLAWLRLADTLRQDARETVTALRGLGLQVVLLSGDRAETVAAIAAQAGIERAEGGLLPADKLERIKRLQRQGARVAMVGDGINDAPVLAAADVSLAIGTGAPLAHAAADAVLLSEHLTVLVSGIELARRALAIIRQNLAWAVAYNVLALPLAAAGWITPWMAAIGMSASSLLVVANALRLKSARRGDRE